MLNYLMDKEVEILAYDENPQTFNHKSVAFALRNQAARKVQDYKELKDVNLIIKSPGIPNDAEWIRDLDRSGVKMVDEIEFVWQELDEPRTVAVTGTNGKSTTTAWIADVLRAGGMTVFCGGNLAPGRPFSESLGDRRYQAYVIEVSTFQLERCPRFRPDIGVLLNVTADHLNRHTLTEYVNLKLSLFKNNRDRDVAVLNVDDDNIAGHLDDIIGVKRLFSVERHDVNAYLGDGILMLGNTEIVKCNELHIPGLHNVANALAAAVVAGEFGIKPQDIKQGLVHFKGLPHRMQFIGEIEGRKIYNNSMCTNPVAFYHSVHSFPEPVVVIAGGTEKGLPLEPFFKGVKQRAKFLVLFGENAEGLRDKVLSNLRFSSCVTVDSLRAAILAALANSRPGERIVFAPGFASFGNFKNFEERGYAFIETYREIKRERQ